MIEGILRRWNFGSRSMFWLRLTWNFLLGSLIFVGAGYAVESYRVSNQPPRTVHEIWTTTPVVNPGGTLIIKIRADINTELCGGRVERQIIRVPNPGETDISRSPVWYSSDEAQKVLPGKNREITVKVPIARDLEPRSYGYQSKVYDRTCADPTRSVPVTVPATVYFTVTQ